jgi:hypothetical protein
VRQLCGVMPILSRNAREKYFGDMKPIVFATIAMAVSVAASSLWIGCFIPISTFSLLKRALNMYGAICFLGFAVVYHWVPETKGKTLEQIERELVD